MKRLLFALLFFGLGMAVEQLQPGQSRAALAPGAAAIDSQPRPLSAAETVQIESYLRRLLGNPDIRLERQPPEADVYLGKQFLGVVYPNEQDGERAYYFEMEILETDLAQSAPAGTRR